MAERPLEQSVWTRARLDTLSALKTFRFWTAEVTLPVIVGIAVALAIPGDAQDAIRALVATGATGLAMLSLASVVLVANVALAPFRQRNEARRQLLKTRSTLDLNVQLGVWGWSTAHGAEDETPVYQIGDILIINREPERVILRLRVRLPMPKGESELLYATAVCEQERSGTFASDAGAVPHLPTEIALGEREHSRGHTEFVPDMPYLERQYGKFDLRVEPGMIEIEEVLSGRVRILDDATPVI